MKVSTKWLNDYVKVDDLDPLALSEKIERTAVEVDDTYKMQDGLKKSSSGTCLKQKLIRILITCISAKWILAKKSLHKSFAVHQTLQPARKSSLLCQIHG